MSKTPKRSAKQTQRGIYKKNVQKLQRAGLLGPVDFRKKASPEVIRRLEKYRAVLTGKAAAVQAGDVKTAQKLRKQLGLKGSGKTIVIPREKNERYRFQKSTNEIVSERPGFNKGEKIKKTLGQKFPAAPEPHSGKKLYYTIPERTRGAGRLKRKTFSSFNELLHYLMSYDVDFEDIEDRLEIEEVRTPSERYSQLSDKIHRERQAAYRRMKRKKGRKGKKAKRGKR